MKTKLVTTVILLSVPTMLGGSANAASAYLKIGNIEGSTTAEGHEQWSDIVEYNIGVNGSFLTPMYVTKYVDTASPELFGYALTGTTIDTSVLGIPGWYGYHAILELGSGEPWRPNVRWGFQDVVIKSYATAGGAEYVPMEAISFDFSKVRYAYYDYSHPLNPEISCEFDRANPGHASCVPERVPANFQFITSYTSDPSVPEPGSILLIIEILVAFACWRNCAGHH